MASLPQGHTPRTNVLWLHYLADVLLTQKRFPCSPEQKRALRAFRSDLWSPKSRLKLKVYPHSS